jgi:hypothetical protein
LKRKEKSKTWVLGVRRHEATEKRKQFISCLSKTAKTINATAQRRNESQLRLRFFSFRVVQTMGGESVTSFYGSRFRDGEKHFSRAPACPRDVAVSPLAQETEHAQRKSPYADIFARASAMNSFHGFMMADLIPYRRGPRLKMLLLFFSFLLLSSLLCVFVSLRLRVKSYPLGHNSIGYLPYLLAASTMAR